MRRSVVRFVRVVRRGNKTTRTQQQEPPPEPIRNSPDNTPLLGSRRTVRRSSTLGRLFRSRAERRGNKNTNATANATAKPTTTTETSSTPKKSRSRTKKHCSRLRNRLRLRPRKRRDGPVEPEAPQSRCQPPEQPAPFRTARKKAGPTETAGENPATARHPSPKRTATLPPTPTETATGETHAPLVVIVGMPPMEEEEGVPSKAIWDPTIESSSGSVTTSSSISSNDENGSLGEEAFADASETDLRMRILHGRGPGRGGSSPCSDEEDDNRLGAMLMSGISRTHGTRPGEASSDAKAAGKARSTNSGGGGDKNDKSLRSTVPLTPAQKLREDRNHFVHSYLSRLTDKQLKTQLWDSFRLARVVTGKTIKGRSGNRKPLGRNATLHAIREVAKMKLQILRMSEELDDYKQKERRRRLERKKAERGSSVQGGRGASDCYREGDSPPFSRASIPGGREASDYGEDDAPPSTPRFGDGKEPQAQEHEGSPATPETPLTPEEQRARDVERQREIDELQMEFDMARDQILEIERQQQQKREEREFLGGLGGEHGAAAKSNRFLLSPSYSTDEDDYYGYDSEELFPVADFPESAVEMLHAFSGARAAKGSPAPAAQEATAEDRRKQDADDSRMEEIRLVLQKVAALHEQQQQQQQQQQEQAPPTEASAVHEEILSLLARLATPPVSPRKAGTADDPSTATKTTAGTQESLMPSPSSLPVQTTVRPEAPATPPAENDGAEGNEAEHSEALAAAEDDDAKGNEALVAPEEDETEVLVIAECEARLSKARQEEFVSKEHFVDLKVQKEVLVEDIANARANTTPNRTALHIERLEGYKEEVETLLAQERERARQIAELDEELDGLAEVCVKLEDPEREFRRKHEEHRRTLSDFGKQARCHTERFRKLLGSIERGIEEHRARVLGDSSDDADSNADPSRGGAGSNEDGSADAETIQKLEFLLAKQNIELFNAKAKLRLREGPAAKG